MPLGGGSAFWRVLHLPLSFLPGVEATGAWSAHGGVFCRHALHCLELEFWVHLFIFVLPALSGGEEVLHSPASPLWSPWEGGLCGFLSHFWEYCTFFMPLPGMLEEMLSTKPAAPLPLHHLGVHFSTALCTALLPHTGRRRNLPALGFWEEYCCLLPAGFSHHSGVLLHLHYSACVSSLHYLYRWVHLPLFWEFSPASGSLRFLWRAHSTCTTLLCCLFHTLSGYIL